MMQVLTGKPKSCLKRNKKTVITRNEANQRSILPLIKALFKLKNGRVFRRDEKLRKRYKCTEIKTKRVYLFSPIAEVEMVEG
jgi:hypothetical protein